MKASKLILQVCELISKHGDREILASIDGNTLAIEDDATIVSEGWVDTPHDDTGTFPFCLEITQFME